MSFIWQATQRLHTPEQVMAVIIQTATELGMPDLRGAAICAGMCVAQESDFWCPFNAADAESEQYDHDSQSDDGRSVGYYQQQKGPGGELWWGPTSQEMDLHLSTREFLTRLKNVGYDASNAQTANDSVQAVQRSGIPQAYRPHWDQINTLYESVVSGGVVAPQPAGTDLTPSPGFSGDPFWLADVLRAEGLSVVEMDGWQSRGEGDQGVLWGAVFHHTGNVNETPEGIAFHPDLGLAAHLLIRPDGTVYVCGIGKANHAGVGSWVGIETDNANEVTIGVEVAILPVENAPHRSGWPDDQYFATVKTMAAILRKLAHQSDRVISHKEWATLGPAGWRQGKWDPGAIDMNIFRSDVAAQIDSHTPTSGDDVPLVTQPSGSIYRESNDPLPWAGTPMDFIMDAQIHEGRVETLAIQGVPKAKALVQAVADGTSPVSDSLGPDAVAQAQAILDVIAKAKTVRKPKAG